MDWMEIIKSMGWIEILLLFILCILPIWIYGRILKKAGYSRWWALLLFVPIINLVAIWVFAFAKWPRLEQTSSVT